MSEASLWDRIRDNVGHMGHFARLEFIPEAGIPDVDFCVRGVEGKIELKFRGDEPARDGTPVFKHKGIRDSQLAWIHTRVRHGGRVWIFAQVHRTLYLVPGARVRDFNQLNLLELAQAATWLGNDRMGTKGWYEFVDALARPTGWVAPPRRTPSFGVSRAPAGRL